MSTPTANSAVRSTISGSQRPKRTTGRLRTNRVVACPSPHHRPSRPALRRESRRSLNTRVDTAVTWSGSVACRMPSSRAAISVPVTLSLPRLAIQPSRPLCSSTSAPRVGQPLSGALHRLLRCAVSVGDPLNKARILDDRQSKLPQNGSACMTNPSGPRLGGAALDRRRLKTRDGAGQLRERRPRRRSSRSRDSCRSTSALRRRNASSIASARRPRMPLHSRRRF